jgi:hypothetical protein
LIPAIERIHIAHFGFSLHPADGDRSPGSGDAVLTSQPQFQPAFHPFLPLAQIRYHDPRHIVYIYRRGFVHLDCPREFPRVSWQGRCLERFPYRVGSSQKISSQEFFVRTSGINRSRNQPFRTPTRRRALRSDDLPTFGMPTTSTFMSCNGSKFLFETSTNESKAEYMYCL